MRKILIFGLLYLICFGLQKGYAQQVRTYESYGKPGEEFKIGQRQCVDFVKENRLDLAGIPYYSAKNMPDMAEKAGFKVDNTPEVGAVIVLPKITDPKTGEITGHVGIVQEKKEENGKFKLTIIDNNFDKTKTIGKAEYLYNPNNNSIEMLDYQKYQGEKKFETIGNEKYSDIKFIHENKAVNNSFFTRLGREPTRDELIDFSQKVLGEIKNGKNLEAAIDTIEKEIFSSEEYRQYLAKLRENIEKLKEQSQWAKSLHDKMKKRAEENAERQFILNALAVSAPLAGQVVLSAAGVADNVVYIGELLQFKRDLKALAPSFDPSKQGEKTPHQNVTPISVSFTQTFEGTFTQIPDYFLAPTADVSINITHGTRIGEGSRPGDFTGSYTASGLTEPGWGWLEHHDTPFSGVTATGTVEAKGFKEGDLKGNMTVNWESTIERVVLTSDKVTIKTDGSLTAQNLDGSIYQISTGVKEGTWSEGTLTQAPK